MSALSLLSVRYRDNDQTARGQKRSAWLLTAEARILAVCAITHSPPVPISICAPPSSPREPSEIPRINAALPRRFRGALAEDIERGEPLQPIRLRARAAPKERRRTAY